LDGDVPARISISLDEDLARQARRLGTDISAAARKGVEDAVRAALARNDRDVYKPQAEAPDSFWAEVEAWADD
jgi:post-segregation antitoxin (ccd killing protein)